MIVTTRDDVDPIDNPKSDRDSIARREGAGHEVSLYTEGEKLSRRIAHPHVRNWRMARCPDSVGGQVSKRFTKISTERSGASMLVGSTHEARDDRHRHLDQDYGDKQRRHEDQHRSDA
jgi:hypothetical protein